MSEFHFNIPELKEILSRLEDMRNQIVELNNKLVPEKKEIDKIIDAKEVCHILNISKRQLHRMEVSGKIKYHKPSGGKRCYFLKDIKEYLNKLRK